MNPKKRKRINYEDRRLNAAKVLAPRLNVDKMEWEFTDIKSVSNSTSNDDALDVRTIMMAISRCNPDRAAICISKFLNDKSNAKIKQIVIESISSKSEEEQVEKLIVKGIRECAAHHNTGGVRTPAAESSTAANPRRGYPCPCGSQ